MDFVDEECDPKDIGANGSPMSIGSFKRPSSTNTTVCSPRKRVKRPLLKIMKGMWDTLLQTATMTQKAMQQTAMRGN